MGIAGFQLLAAQVAVFDNDAYVDTDGGEEAESDTVQATLAALGHAVRTFTGISAPALKAALANAQVLVIPEMENGNLAPDLSDAAIEVLRDFVNDGGTIIVHGGIPDGGGGARAFLNKVFDTSLTNGVRYSGDEVIDQAGGVADTGFEGDPATLPGLSATLTFDNESLPDNALKLYKIAGDSAAFAMPFGLGQVIYLGWDWHEAEPLGGEDGGWLQVLASAVSVRTGKVFEAGNGDSIITNGNGKTTNKADAVSGAGGDDTIEGGKGFDLLFGGADDDDIDGGGGNDLLSGGAGKDKLTGGKGGDNFEFDTSIAEVDRILDFKPGKDLITLGTFVFSVLTPGELPPGAFRIGDTALDGDDRILYDDETGRLRYDADGDLGGAAVVFARLDAGLDLSAADFYVQSFVV